MYPIRSSGPAVVPAPQARVVDLDVGFIRQGVAFWCERLPATERAALARQWIELHRTDEAGRGAGGNLQASDARAIFALLHRLSQTPYVEDKRDAAVGLLQAMAGNPAFREACCAQARLGTEDCHDNALAQFEAIALQLPFQLATKAGDFVKAAHDVAATNLLQAFVGEAFPQASEALEVFQYLKGHVGPRFGLPESHMRYERYALHYMGDRADGLVRRAEQHVQHGLRQETTRVLLSAQLWTDYLATHFREELDHCTASVQDAMEGVLDGDMASQRAERRAGGLQNIFRNTEDKALERLTALCVEEGLGRGDGVRERVRAFLGLANHGQPNVTARVQARLQGPDGLRPIVDEAAAQAARWAEPTDALVQQQWGRRAGAGDAARVDPMLDHQRQQQPRQVPSAAPLAIAAPQAEARAAFSVTHLVDDPEELELQLALHASLRDAGPDDADLQRAIAASLALHERALPAAVSPNPPVAPAPAREPPSAVEQAFALLRGDRGQPMPAVDRAELAFGQVRRLASPVSRSTPSYMVDPARLRGMLTHTARIGGNTQRALALHADATLFDLMRMHVKSHPGDAGAMLAALSDRSPSGGRTALQIVAALLAPLPAADPDVEIAQARLSTAVAYALRRIVATIGDTHGAAHARQRMEEALDRDKRLFDQPPRANSTPQGVLAMRLRAFGLDPLQPPLAQARLADLEAPVDRAIRAIANPALQLAYSPTIDLRQVGARLSDVIVAQGRALAGRQAR